MRSLLILSASLATILLAGGAAAQSAVQSAAPATETADPAVQPPAAAAEAEDVLTWEELPESIRQRADRLIGRPPAQAVLHVEAPVAPDDDFHVVDHGDILFQQAVRPAGVARITRPVRNEAKYGPMGAALWPGVGPEGDYWCWRRVSPDNAWARGNIYCYEDKDGDGTSERMMENDVWMLQLASSHFQFLSLGHDEGVEESASFEVEPDTLGEFRELVVLRYYGATRGLVQPDGSLAPATVEFELLAGPNLQSLSVVSRVRALIGPDGKGEYHALNGIHLLVDGVNVDGAARVRLLDGLPEGRALLIAPLTREMVVEWMSEAFNPDGTPKARPAANEGQADAADEAGAEQPAA